MPTLHLLPEPKSVEFTGGSLPVPARGTIILETHAATRDPLAAERFAATLAELGAGDWHIVRDTLGTACIDPPTEIRCHFDASVSHDQGYRLTVTKDGIDTYARTAAGTFYAMQTLAQIFLNAVAFSGKRAAKLPCVAISDFPDFARRGVYHDCARGKVPTLATLVRLVDDLASLKINEFQLYIENAYEFRRHPEMYDDTTPLTAEELMILDDHCRELHIDFVPSLTSLGHFEKILCRPAFRKLAEAEPDDLRKQGINVWCDQPWSLCVIDEGAQQLLADMYNEFLPNFSSDTFNICCDESWDLGKGRSKPLADQIGTGQVYVNWINRCDALAKAHGKKIQMWGDIIRHHPDLLGELPTDATLHEWGYEADHEFDARCKPFADAGKRFYVAPGTSSWITFASRTKNAMGNIHAAATAGLKHGASGLLNTDWGDMGHQQMLAVSLLPFAYGAAASWNVASVANPATEKNSRALAPFLKAASLHVFLDPTLTFAGLAYDLGLCFERFGWQRGNASLEWYLFREHWNTANYVNRATPAGLARVEKAMKELIPQFAKTPLGHADAAQIRDEFVFTCREILHCVRRARVRQQWIGADPKTRNPDREDLRDMPPKAYNAAAFKRELKALTKDAARLKKEFARLWRARNKESRLADVLWEFDRVMQEYRSH